MRQVEIDDRRPAAQPGDPRRDDRRAALGCFAGKALIEVVANATDLTDPSVWKNGTAEGLVFRSIRDGAGLAMPPFKTEVAAQDDLWHLVNFVRSLWPAK